MTVSTALYNPSSTIGALVVGLSFFTKWLVIASYPYMDFIMGGGEGRGGGREGGRGGEGREGGREGGTREEG